MTVDNRDRTDQPLPAVPWIPPSVRRVWRDVGRLQIGTDPDRATVLTGVDGTVAAFIGGLDGTRSLRDHRDRSALRADDTDQVLRALAQTGCLADLTGPSSITSARDSPPGAADESLKDPALDRTGDLALHSAADPTGHVKGSASATSASVHSSALVAELAGRSLGRDAAPPLLAAARRTGSSVQIVGGRVVPALLARLLAAAGVGRIVRQVRGTVAPLDIACGDAPPGSVGEDRADSWRVEMSRLHPQLRTDPLGSLEQPDLVILCDPWPGRDDREQTLQRLGSPYLCATVRERRAIVGPLVLPGRSSCLRCQHLHRVDADPGWAAIDAQLRAAEPTAGQAGEIVCGTLAAAIAGAQALQWLDGEQHPETIDATIDIALPDLVLHRRHWPAHPECACTRRIGLGYLTPRFRH